MKNWEYWEKELRAIGNFDFAVVNGMVKSCSGTCCDDCKFGNSCNCNDGRLTWLYSDKEPTLTQEEKTFVDMLKDGYIARDKSGLLLLFDGEPQRLNIVWTNATIDSEGCFMHGRRCTKIDKEKFQFIQWENEPYKVEDLKKIEGTEIMTAKNAQVRASMRYDAKNTVKFTVKLNRRTDRDLIERMESVSNKNGYIKELIRKDIEDGKDNN